MSSDRNIHGAWRRGVSVFLACSMALGGLTALTMISPTAAGFATPGLGVTWTLDDLVLNSAGAVTGGGGMYIFHETVMVMPSDLLMINGPNMCFFDPLGPGIYLEILGGLNIDGMGMEVLFTSASPTPMPGDWGGIRFTGFGGFNQIMFATVEYATDGIFVDNSMLPMLDSTKVRYCSGTGIYYNWVMGGPSVTNCEVHHNTNGIVTINSTMQIGNMGPNYIHNNSIDGIYGEGMGVGAYGNRIENNGCFGIRGSDWSGSIFNCNITGNLVGIHLTRGRVSISDTNITNCAGTGLHVRGPIETWSTMERLRVNAMYSDGIILEDVHEFQYIESVCVEASVHLALRGWNSNATFANSTVTGSGIASQIDVDDDSHFILLNTTFDKARASFGDASSDIEVRWFMNVLVQNPHLEPLQGAALRVTDNSNGTSDANYTTGADGYKRYIQATEYVQTLTTLVRYTQHNVSAGKPGYIPGWAAPEPLMDQSRTVVITLGYAMADLQVSVPSISFLPNDRIDKGWLVTIQAIVSNGGGRADNVMVHFMDGASLLGTQSATVLTLAQSIYTLNWTPPEKGNYDVRIVVDPLDIVAEVNETNNVAQSQLNVHDWTDHFDNETRVMSKANVVVAGSSAMLREIWDVKYEADTIPETASPSWVITGSTVLRSVSNGILRINDYTTGNYCYFYRAWAISRYTNFTIEARVWIEDSDPAPPKIEFYDGRNVEFLLFHADRIELDYANLVYNMNTTDGYHDYRITRGGALGRDLKVYVDGVLRIDAPGAYTTASTANRVRFGSFSTTAVSRSWWDYVRYSLVGAYPGNTMYFATGTLLSGDINLAETNWDRIYVDKFDSVLGTSVSISVLDTSNNSLPGFVDRLEEVIDIYSINPSVYATIRIMVTLSGNGDATPVLRALGVDSKTTFSLPLALGWNLVSVPLALRDSALDVALASIAGKWDKIFAYDPFDADAWKSNFTMRPDFLDDLKAIGHTQGFWLNVTAPGTTLTVEGFLPTSNAIQLRVGWNLVGYPVRDDSVYTVGMLKAATGATIVEGLDGGAEYLTQILLDGYVMSRGEGYWINVSADTVWLVDW